MRLKRKYLGYEVELLVGQRSILDWKETIDAYRKRIGQDASLLTSVKFFLLKKAVWNELPMALMLRRAGSLRGVVLLHYPKAYGIPYGVARGGMRGEPCVIAPSTDQVEMLETGARFLIDHALAHTVMLTLGYPVPVAGDRGRLGCASAAGWYVREDAHRLPLSRGSEATMESLSYKLRRNLRYYRRRAGTVRFLPELTTEQRGAAVAALFHKGRYPTPPKRAWRWEHALQATPGAFAMGLTGESGEWLSYVAGWRDQSATYIDWQLNDESAGNESTSTVMRSFLLEHEAERHSPALVFVGGTSAIWMRACEPFTASDLLVTGGSLMARSLQHAFQRLRPGTDVDLLFKRALGMRAPG